MRTVIEAATLVRRGELSARELLDDCLARIARHGPALKAFVYLDPDLARREAAAIDAVVARGEDPGPLAGVPFGVKDLDDCAGMPTQHGSRWFAGSPAKGRDSLHVGRLRAAGAVPLGKTAAPEFGAWAYTASPAFGVTRNPWDLDRTPGGSSGGSAAAVAAGLVPFATASDGGGSTRTPANFCGLVGHKPSYGRIPERVGSRYGQLAVVGALTTTVSDSARLLDVMSGPHRHDRTSLPAVGLRYEQVCESMETRGLRAAWSADLGFVPVEPEVARVTEEAARTLAEAAGLVWVERPFQLDDFVGTWSRLGAQDRWVDLPEGLWPDRADELDPLAAPGWSSGDRVTLRKFGRVLTARLAVEEELARLFDDIDVLLTPMSAAPAFAAEGPMPTMLRGAPAHGGLIVAYPMLANLWGSPAISVPAGRSRAGLPIGLQIMGDRHRDDIVLRLARVWEQTRPWPRLAPLAGP